MKERIDSPRKLLQAFFPGGRLFSSPRIRGVALAMLAGSLAPAAEARVFKPSQVGLYHGNGTGRTVVAGVSKSPQTALSRIRVGSNSLRLDGVNFRFTSGKIRGRYFDFGLGLSMVLDGTYRKAGERIIARGSVKIFSLETATTADGTWNSRFFADGKRAYYVLAIRIPDPENPAVPLAVIHTRANGTKSP